MLKKILPLLSLISLFVSCKDSNENPSALTVSFKNSQTNVVESNNSIFVPLQLDGKSSKEILVTYEVSGTAGFPSDVTPLTSTTFIIPAGATAFNMEFLIIKDGIVELEAENLEIKLISISEGGSLGDQVIHNLNIEPDDVTVIGFENTTSEIEFGESLKLTVNLSQAYEKDLTIELDLSENPSYTYGNNYFNGGTRREFIIPSGSESLEVEFEFNNEFRDYTFSTKNLRIQIVDAVTDLGIKPLDVIVDNENDNVYHTFSITNNGKHTPGLKIDLSWTSTNQDVDLDLYVTDADGDPIFQSENDGPGVTESIFIDASLLSDNVNYFIYVLWYSGNSTTCSPKLTISPKYGIYSNGSQSSFSKEYSNLTEEESSSYYAVIDKFENAIDVEFVK
ncbi:hypothetical protein GCM10011506_14830 [Marivirga lumbricoides]|uniref:Calx-beta domain-containing protein n=1 Tax=Marivirga lumbricoides TaxID=1046115 RepID=A0ABQ1LVQ5_9BACT|nr:hypothetical protein GCM10011506_14830 [Marivirga lumbricoides]